MIGVTSRVLSKNPPKPWRRRKAEATRIKGGYAHPDVVRADNGQVTFQPLANDSDPDGDTIALQSVR